MQKRAYIHAMLSYIEDHLSEDLKPESIAGGHFISVSQWYRDFYAFTGHSVKEYIRKRRISNACEKIKCSELPLTVIADESGYQTDLVQIAVTDGNITVTLPKFSAMILQYAD